MLRIQKITIYVLQWNYFNYMKTESDVMFGCSIFCIGSNFTMNRASKGGVIYMYGMAKNNNGYTVHLLLNRSKFAFNNANIGGVFVMRYLNATVHIHNSSFQNNKADHIGGVGYCYQSILLIKLSTFSHNRAVVYAGVLFLGYSTRARENWPQCALHLCYNYCPQIPYYL